MTYENATGAGESDDRTASDPELALLAIGCSAGGLPALIELVAGLPADLRAAVLICQHTTQHGGSNLPTILARWAPLPVDWARDGDRLQAGRIYVAPPGHHLMVDDAVARLSHGPRVNRHRPSVDVLFASVAKEAGSAGTVVVLSGVLDDGAVGSALVDRAGGQVVVQNPDLAEFAGMPRAAIRAAPNAKIAHDRLSADVVQAVQTAISRKVVRPMADKRQGRMEAYDASEDRAFLQPGESRVVRLACPDCGGGLAQVDLPQISYFRCHVGHQYGPESLVAAMADASESRLWSAVAALEEEALLQGVVEGLPAGSENVSVDARTPSQRYRDLWSRAAALRGHAQEWTGAGRQGDQPFADETSFDEKS